MGDILRLTAKLAFRSPQVGAQSVLYCLVEESIDQHVGKIIYDCKPVEVEAIGRDYRVAERLWAVSHDACNLDPEGTVSVNQGQREEFE